MKATELRIGNYVVGKKWPEYDLELIVVTSVDDIGINLEEGLGEGIRREFYHHDISPIPLTTEILEKCGFEKREVVEDGIIYGKTKYTLIYTIATDGLHHFFLNGYHNDVQIDNLHQLQNLYFALTGEELDFIFKST